MTVKGGNDGVTIFPLFSVFLNSPCALRTNLAFYFLLFYFACAFWL